MAQVRVARGDRGARLVHAQPLQLVGSRAALRRALQVLRPGLQQHRVAAGPRRAAPPARSAWRRSARPRAGRRGRRAARNRAATTGRGRPRRAPCSSSGRARRRRSSRASGRCRAASCCTLRQPRLAGRRHSRLQATTSWPSAKQSASTIDLVAEHALDGEAAAVDRRAHALDDDAHAAIGGINRLGSGHAFIGWGPARPRRLEHQHAQRRQRQVQRMLAAMRGHRHRVDAAQVADAAAAVERGVAVRRSRQCPGRGTPDQVVRRAAPA